jgi:hypothetical protein
VNPVKLRLEEALLAEAEDIESKDRLRDQTNLR